MRWIFLGILAWAAPGLAAQAARAWLDPATCTLGEAVTLYVQANTDGERPLLPDSMAADFEVEALGESRSSQVHIVNGQMSQSLNLVFPWRLQPRRAGELAIPEFSFVAKAGGATRLRVPPLIVREPDSPGDVFVTAVARPPRAVRESAAGVTLLIEIGLLDSGGAEPQGSMPRALELVVPWLQLPSGCEGADVSTWLTPLAVQRGAFSIAGVTQPSASFLGSPQTAYFRLPARRETRPRPDQPGVTASYWIYTLERRMTCVKNGTFDLGRVILRGRVADRSWFLTSEPVVLEVTDPPAAGRPDSFTGAIGALAVRARAEPTSVRVGDPITVTIGMGGVRYLDDLHLPDLSAQAALAGDFKIHTTETGIVTDGWKEFSVTLRPMRGGITVIPPIELAAYDDERAVYTVQKTAAIPITVAGATSLPAQAVESAAGVPSGEGLALSTTGLFANHQGEDLTRNHAVQPLRVAGFVGMLAALYAALAVFEHGRRRRARDPKLVRRRSAARRASERLAAANDAAGVGAALRGLVADACGIEEAGLTSTDCARVLHSGSLGEAERTRICQLLERCEAARYGGEGVDLQGLRADARVSLEAFARWLGGLILALVLAMPAAQAETVPLAELVDAERAFAAAKTPSEYLAAAAHYRAVIERGHTNGHVLFNLGNAYAHAGEIGRAIAAYEHAAWYIPRDPDLIENLRVVRQRAIDGIVRPVPLATRIFVFTGITSEREQALIVEVLALVASVLASARLFAPRHVPRVAVLAFAALFLVGALGFGLAFRDRHAHVHGVVTADTITARRGPGATYEPAFTRDLHAGAPCQVIEERQDWVAIEVPGAGRAWVPADTVVTYP